VNDGSCVLQCSVSNKFTVGLPAVSETEYAEPQKHIHTKLSVHSHNINQLMHSLCKIYWC